MEANSKIKLLICPYCPPKSRTSHRTASYKIKQTKTGLLIMRCKACNKTMKVQITGDFIFKDEFMHPISMEEKE